MVNLTDQSLISTFEAKTYLSQLLKKVEQGYSFTITKHNHPIAFLFPANVKKRTHSIQEVISQIKRDRLFGRAATNLSELQRWREEGRR